MPITETRTSFKAVYIPADPKVPVVEVTVPIVKDEELSAMTDFVKKHLTIYDEKRKASMDEVTKKAEFDAVGEQLNKMIAERPELSNMTVTEDMIRQVYSSNSVDNVPLLVNNKANGFTTVILYCDDQGIAKKLPMNERATGLCCAVKKPVQVLGDAFVAMAFDNDDDFLRKDFTIAELDLARPWAKMALAANAAKEANAGVTPSGVSTVVRGGKPAARAGAPAPTGPGAGKVCGEGHLGCSRAAPLRCGACKSVNYCSPDHQQFDWKRHKAECKERAAKLAGGSA